MGVAINLSADPSAASADATSNAAGAKSMGFEWSLTNGNWSVSPASETVAASVDSNGWATASGKASINSSAGGVCTLTLRVVVYDSGNSNIDEATKTANIGPV